MSMEEAQLETKAILANLQKGHEALLTDATNKAVKPMNFAWDGAAAGNLANMSENKAAFPVHDVTLKTDPFKPATGEGPINTLKEFSNTAVWKSESGANFLPSPGKDHVQVPAGFHSKPTIDMPTQFAWKRLDVNAAAEEEKGSAIDDEPAESAEPEAEEKTTAAPGAAGATAEKKDEIPTYYAWKPYQSMTETEYDAKYVGTQSPERVKHAHKSTAPSLDGIISQNVAPLTETEYDAKFIGTQSPEPVQHAEKGSEPTLDGIIYQTDAPLGMTEYDSMTKDAAQPHEAVEHVKKSADPTLEGVLDNGAGFASKGTEYDAKFKSSEAMSDMIEQVAKAQKETKQSLQGIFKYPGVTNAFISEYDANFAKKEEDASSTVDTAAAVGLQDEGASAESASEASPEPAAAPKVQVSQPVAVMNGGDSAAEAISPTEAPPAPAAKDDCCDCCEPVDCCDPEPASEAVNDCCADADCCDPEPASEAVNDCCADADCCNPEPASEAVNDCCADADCCKPAPTAAPAPAAAPASTFNAFETVSHLTYQWPITAGQKPAEGKPTSSDLVSGVMQAAPEGAIAESDLEGQLAVAKKKMTSEYDSKYAWPVNSLNKRSYATGMPDSLWVLGTKGTTNVAVKERKVVTPKPSTKNAEQDHLSGAACVPDALDALDSVFVNAATGKGAAVPSKPETFRAKPRIQNTKTMPVAGYVPGGPREVLVSKDQPVEGQIPELRNSLAPNPVSALNALPMPRPVTEGGHRIGRIMGAPMTLDPVRANPRYPQLSERQANRWQTTASAAYGAPKRFSRFR